MSFRVYYATRGDLTTCSECLAIVPHADQAGHDRWHNELDQRLTNLRNKLDQHEHPTPGPPA